MNSSMNRPANFFGKKFADAKWVFRLKGFIILDVIIGTNVAFFVLIFPLFSRQIFFRA